MVEGQADITSVLNHLLKQQSATDADIDAVDGNPFEYHNFIKLFHELVEIPWEWKRMESVRNSYCQQIFWVCLTIL